MHAPAGTGKEDVQTAPTCRPAYRSEILANNICAGRLAECCGDVNHISFITLNVLQILDKERLTLVFPLSLVGLALIVVLKPLLKDFFNKVSLGDI